MGKLSSTVAVVGAGSMGGAIASGLVVSGVAEPSRVMACDPSQEKLALLGEKGIQTFDDAAMMLAVVSVIADKLVDREVISIAAGVPLATLEGLLPVSRVVRVMPNLPVQVLSGATAVCPGGRATDEDVDVALQVFGALGTAKVMREDQLDAEGAVVSCGPAYVALFVDLLTRAGIENGLPASDCREMVLSTMRGVCTQLLESGEHPRVYMERVTSPGGTTAAGLRAMESQLSCAVYEAADAALERTRELAKG